MLSRIVQQAKKDGLDKYISGQQKFNKIMQFRNKEFNTLGFQAVTIQLPYDVAPDVRTKIQTISEQVRQSTKSEAQIQITQSIGVGEKLPNFGQIKKVLQQGCAELSAKQGQVLLIDVWATWCGPCQRPMQHNQTMIQKNNWGDNVRIVGVSVDDDVSQVQQRIKSKGWTSVEHLTLQKWDGDHNLVKNFGINGIPFVCLVDTKGIINYTGHPSSINLQQRINQLLKGEGQAKKQQQKQNEKFLSQQQANKIIKTVANQEFFKENFGKFDFICSRVEIQTTLNSGKFNTHAKCSLFVNEQNKQLLSQYQSLLPSKNVQFVGKLVDTIKVPEVPEKCCQCAGQLKFPLYWCRWSANAADFRCRNCIQKKVDDLNFSYKDNSILLFEYSSKIPSKALGKNLQPKQGLQNLSPHSFGCNGCGGCPQSVGQARYICLGCRSQPNHRGDYIDLCQECLNKYIQKQQDVVNALAADKHQQSHPFLRILYNTQGYYSY